MSGTERKVDAVALRELGFPEDLIAEALRRQERGLLEVEPPADLVQRTIETCTHLFPRESGESQETKEPAWGLFHEALGIGRLAPNPASFAAVASGLSNHYASSLGFAFKAHKPPLVMLDNHNLIEPEWWQQDPIFRCMRTATGTVNHTVREHGIAPSALLVFLRPKVSDYKKAELAAIANMVAEASSDIWWTPYDAANPYAGQDVVAMGEKSLLKIDIRAETPLKAIQAMKTTTDPDLVRKVRSDLLGYISHATPVKVDGKLYGALAQTELSPQNVRNAIDRVISGVPAPTLAVAGAA
jgi:hypothetical protein